MLAKKILLEKQNKPGRDIQHILELWGAWAANDNSQIDWQPVAAGFKRLLPHTKKSRPQCDDDYGIIIDAAVACLQKVRKPQELQLIIVHYVYGVSKRAIARHLGLTEGRIRQKMQISEAFIEAYLNISGVIL
ncbi:TPA: antitermination protein [Yersinia enterocolitica]|uniref:antiterminator Q family protein n=1 Tax=Yersinia kristensenii TaxID=28152 RepID=UPI001C610A62|nr:antiterminator Q family protein [Yersinia kristensenii]MBW5814394.1 antitermination protein [Yersinia kristensenii]HDL7801222.1 antitermination protein [Yersinia enterocolitica]